MMYNEASFLKDLLCLRVTQMPRSHDFWANKQTALPLLHMCMQSNNYSWTDPPHSMCFVIMSIALIT